MIERWRTAFETPRMPFFYVELPTEFGAEEPKEQGFWLAQRSALNLPSVGFAVTTDIQRALHPPDKQDVARRLFLEMWREVYGHNVISRGPELVNVHVAEGKITFKFSNTSLVTKAGIFIGYETDCEKAGSPGYDSVATDPLSGFRVLNYTIQGSNMVVSCTSANGMVQINSDRSQCFLYGPSGLPAPPVQHFCNASASSIVV